MCIRDSSYAHQFIVDENVTWLEGTTAAPVFSGLVTYYIEGDPGDRHNLMQVPVGSAQKSCGVRGNLFSCLLPWEKMLQQQFEKIQDGDLTDWPLAPEHARHVVRVSFLRGPESLLSKFKDLLIRFRIVKQLAHIYIYRKSCARSGRSSRCPGDSCLRAMCFNNEQFKTTRRSMGRSFLSTSRP